MEFLDFKANGQQVAASKSDDGTLYTLKIGDPGGTVFGHVIYTIQYRVTHALTNEPAGEGLGERAELYWNAVPTGWPTASSHSHIRIEYPDPKPGNFGARVLFGPQNDRAGIQHLFGKPVIGRTDLLETHYNGRTSFDVETKKGIQKGFGVTVVFGLPKGTVEETDDRIMASPRAPTGTSQEDSSDSHDDFSFPTNPLGLLLPIIPALMAVPWAISRRPKSPGPLVVRFDPPEGIDPIQAGVLADNRFEPRDVLAGIVSLAQKGALVMRAGDSITLTLTGARPASLSYLELQLLNALTPFGPEINPSLLVQKFNVSYTSLKFASENSLLKGGLRRPSASGGCAMSLVIILFIALSIVGFGVGGFFGCGGVVGGLIALIVVFRMPSPWTQQGASKRWELDGLREFIMRAQKDPIEFAVKYVPNAALYEKLLPYAIGFGLAREWSSAFQGIDMPAPAWFDGADTHVAWNTYFYDHYNTFDSEWSHAVTSTPPPTWSSGGSGFSGGDSGGFSSGGGFDGGGGFSGGGDVGGGGGGGGGGDW